MQEQKPKIHINVKLEILKLKIINAPASYAKILRKM